MGGGSALPQPVKTASSRTALVKTILRSIDPPKLAISYYTTTALPNGGKAAKRGLFYPPCACSRVFRLTFGLWVCKVIVIHLTVEQGALLYDKKSDPGVRLDPRVLVPCVRSRTRRNRDQYRRRGRNGSTKRSTHAGTHRGTTPGSHAVTRLHRDRIE